LSKADLLHSGLKHKKKKPPKLSTWTLADCDAPIFCSTVQ
jgi:hypothetical protein